MRVRSASAIRRIGGLNIFFGPGIHRAVTNIQCNIQGKKESFFFPVSYQKVLQSLRKRNLMRKGYYLLDTLQTAFWL